MSPASDTFRVKTGFRVTRHRARSAFFRPAQGGPRRHRSRCLDRSRRYRLTGCHGWRRGSARRRRGRHQRRAALHHRRRRSRKDHSRTIFAAHRGKACINRVVGLAIRNDHGAAFRLSVERHKSLLRALVLADARTVLSRNRSAPFVIRIRMPAACLSASPVAANARPIARRRNRNNRAARRIPDRDRDCWICGI